MLYSYINMYYLYYKIHSVHNYIGGQWSLSVKQLLPGEDGRRKDYRIGTTPVFTE